MLYHLAVTTGLRASELASLTPRSFDLGSDPPTVAVEAGYSKHRRRDVLPLRADVANAMSEYLSSRQLRDDERLWTGSWSRKGSAIMIRKDLAAADIPYEDDAGRVFDFHALRHQFISSLAQAGVHPKEAQSLARHSTISLTMDRYTHLNVVDLTGALDRLPAIAVEESESEPQVLAATGTDDAQPSNVDNDKAKKMVPTMVPRGAENGAERLAPRTLKMAPNCTEPKSRASDPRARENNAKSPAKHGALGVTLHQDSSNSTKRRAWDSNPQPVARHLNSNQAASHSLTLQNLPRIAVVGPVRGPYLCGSRSA